MPETPPKPATGTTDAKFHEGPLNGKSHRLTSTPAVVPMVHNNQSGAYHLRIDPEGTHSYHWRRAVGRQPGTRIKKP